MNPTLSTRDITLELLAIQDHIRKKPVFESGNLLVVAGWHAVAELLYMSRYLCPCDMSDTECTAQRNILYWEMASPHWELPEYVDAMALDVQVAKDWIAHSAIRTGGPSHAHAPKAASDGESEVDQSGGDHKEVPLSPGLARPKVQTKDLENIVLDKGPWAATPGVRQGWRIFVGVSSLPPVPPDILTDPQYTGPSGMARPDLPTVHQAWAYLFGTGGSRVWPVHARQEGVPGSGRGRFVFLFLLFFRF